jgi:hypothetical protein
MIGNPMHVQNDRDDKINSPLLFTNYPNPFNPRTVISYNVAVRSQVNLKIYNAIGQEIATLADGIEDAGIKNIEWDASLCSSGIYFSRITVRPLSGSSVSRAVRKIILLR